MELIIVPSSSYLLQSMYAGSPCFNELVFFYVCLFGANFAIDFNFIMNCYGNIRPSLARLQIHQIIIIICVKYPSMFGKFFAGEQFKCAGKLFIYENIGLLVEDDGQFPVSRSEQYLKCILQRALKRTATSGNGSKLQMTPHPLLY